MDKSTAIKKRSSRQLTDKSIDKPIDKSIDKSNYKKSSISNPIYDLNDSANQSTKDESIDDDENKAGKLKERLGDFLAKVQDCKVMNDYFLKIDKHVNNLLDVVKLKEKKRKGI